MTTDDLPLLHVRIVDGSAPGTLTAPGPYIVGRDDTATIVSADKRVSRLHAIVEVVDGRWLYRDRSRSGTFEGDTRIGDLAIDRPVVFRLAEPDDGPTLTLTPVAAPPPPPPPDLRPVPTTAPPLPAGPVAGASSAFSRAATQGPDQSTSGEVHGDDGGAALRAEHVRVEIGDAVILSDVTIEARLGTFTAVVGPTGAGKSTLLRVLAGELPPTAGRLIVNGNDVYAGEPLQSSPVGCVPQDDIVHSQLTVRQALRFGAELRLPDLDNTAIEGRVDDILGQLGLTDHAHKRISSISGGQRKRVSVGLELLAKPDVLVLDEATSGLDPAYEQAIMRLLRALADDGSAVIIVTHSVASLDLCDSIVFLGTGGWVASVGMTTDAFESFGVTTYPEMFAKLEAPAPTSHGADGSPPPPPPPRPDSPVETSAAASSPGVGWAQWGILVRRHVSILASEPRTLAVLAAAALVPATVLAAMADAGVLATVDPTSAGARTLIGGLMITVAVIGAANGLREIVKELPIYRRERAAGMRRTPYLLSKLCVLSLLTAVQAVVVYVVATFRAVGPTSGNMFPGRIELLGVALVVAVVGLLVGLAVSATVSNSEKAMAFVPILFVVFWLMSGMVSSLANKPVLREAAYFSPSNWAMAAGASTADLPVLEGCSGSARLGSEARSCDVRWSAGLWPWAGDMFALITLGGFAYVYADWSLSRKEPLPALRRRNIAADTLRRARRLLDR